MVVRNMIRTVLVVCLSIWLSGEATAQKDTVAVSFGYFAPYGVQVGGKTGLSFNLKSWTVERENRSNKIRKIDVSPQVGYFFFPGVQNNLLLNCDVAYSVAKSGARVVPIASIGLGYLLARQRQEGTVNLATGELKQDVKTLHYFTPTVNAGFAVSTKRSMSYFMKAFYGRKIGFQQEDASFFGLELGLSVKLKREN